MNITAILNSIYEFKNGCFFTRIHVPFLELKRRGHNLSYAVLEKIEDEEKMIRENDIFVFMRLYHPDPFKLLWHIKSRGKKIVYELDDDIWTIQPVNPAQPFFKPKFIQERIEGMLKEADLVTTTTPYLKKVLSKFNKNIWVCPNAVNFEMFKERPWKREELRIGWSGSITHFDDLLLIIDVIKDLQKKYDFTFFLQGIVSSPLISEIFAYNFLRKQNWIPELNNFFDKAILFWEKLNKIKYKHIPFHNPFLYPQVLTNLDLDIGLCPLIDNPFNRSKSNIKFYEYCAVGTVTLASDVLPYNQEVNYLAKNTYKDWYEKLEKLIVDEKFREKILDEQRKFVSQNRDIEKVGEIWEKAFKSLL